MEQKYFYISGLGILYFLLGENSLVFDFFKEKCREEGNSIVKGDILSIISVVIIEILGIMDVIMMYSEVLNIIGYFYLLSRIVKLNNKIAWCFVCIKFV